MKTRVVIIGGGIIGTSIARELSKYEVEIILLEKETDLAFVGSSKANTGLIHAGYDEIPGTLMAELCSRGNFLWSKLARELSIPFKVIRSLVVALEKEEEEILDELETRGRKNKVPDLEIIEDRKRLFEMEPNLNESTVAALYAPTAGIVNPMEAVIALAENAVKNGARVLLGNEALNVMVKNRRVKGVQTNEGMVEADFVINAAGLWADEISSKSGIDHYTILPRKGEYLIFDKKLDGFVNHILFPVPTPVSKGIVVTPTIDGNLLIGPNVKDVEEKYDLTTTRSGLKEVFQGAIKLVPKLSREKNMIIANYSGLRAASNKDDFIIESYEEVSGFINVAGIQSPGLTAAPAIAEKVIDLLKKSGLELKEKTTFDPRRRPIARSFRDPSIEMVDRLISKNPSYGHVICRCEYVTEGEVMEAIERGATTLDGIKFRTRAGMGRCQGGFCTPHLVKILARELAIPIEEVTKRGGDSKLLPYRVKSLFSRV